MVNINIGKRTHIKYYANNLYTGETLRAYDPSLGENIAWNGGGREKTPNGFIKEFKIYDSRCNIVPCVGDEHIYLGGRNGYGTIEGCDFQQLSVGTGGNDNPIIAGGVLVGNNILYDNFFEYCTLGSDGNKHYHSYRAEMDEYSIYLYNGDEFWNGARATKFDDTDNRWVDITLKEMGIDLNFGVKFGFYSPEVINRHAPYLSTYVTRWFAHPEATMSGSGDYFYTPQNFYHPNEEPYPTQFGCIQACVGLFVRRYYRENTILGEQGNDPGYLLTPVSVIGTYDHQHKHIDKTNYYLRSLRNIYAYSNYDYMGFPVILPFLNFDEYKAAKCLLDMQD